MDTRAAAPPLEGGSGCVGSDAAVFGVVTVSDRASAGTYSDLSGPAILHFFSEAIVSRCTSAVLMRCRLLRAVIQLCCVSA